MDDTIIQSPVATAALLDTTMLGPSTSTYTSSSSSEQQVVIHSTNSSQQSIDTPIVSTPSTTANNDDANNDNDLITIGSSKIVDEYELGPAIGFGSTAIVHAGRHLSTGQSVAIKVFDLDRFEHAQIDRLRQELAVMSLCCSAHPHLLSHSACLTRGNELWLVMPLCNAGSVADVLRWAFPDGLEEAAIACILQQTVAGLCHLHSAGHCHRDIKAANLLLDNDGTVRLADFGVSASLDPSGIYYDHHYHHHDHGQDSSDHQQRPDNVTTMATTCTKRRKTFVGTPCWMAPEVMEGGGYDGAKADIWSIGILALELAYGQAPFAKYPPMKVIYLTLSATTPPTLERERCRHRYSRTLKDFVDSCLVRDAEKRPSAEQLLKHPLLRSVKKPAFLVDRVVAKCPPITARNLSAAVVAITKEPTANEPVVEWDFSDNEVVGASTATTTTIPQPPPLPPQAQGNTGTVSRRGRFIVQGDHHPGDGPDDAEVVMMTALCNRLQEHGIGSTIQRKGRFSIECNDNKGGAQVTSVGGVGPSASSAAATAAVFSNSISIPAVHIEQLCLLVDMLKEQVDCIAGRTAGATSTTTTAATATAGSLVAGQHRRSSTSLGNASKRESIADIDRRDSSN